MKQQPLIGFFLALTAITMWGLLPIAIQQVLPTMNSQTIVWFRFISSAIALSCWLGIKGNFPPIKHLYKQHFIWLLFGILGLSANFLLFNLALNYIPPSSSQVLSPISSFLMLFAGVFVFKEKIGLHQKLGLVILLIGLGLFFNQRFADFAQMNSYFQGIIMALCASSCWLGYGMAQKLLLTRLTSSQILCLIYIGCTVLFTPFADWQQTADLNRFQLGCLVFCCLNTIIAYGTYGEAINRWDVSKVSAMMTQIPIFTIIFSNILTNLYPHIFADNHLNWMSYVGAATVVSGALLSVTGHKFAAIFNRTLRVKKGG